MLCHALVVQIPRGGPGTGRRPEPPHHPHSQQESRRKSRNSLIRGGESDAGESDEYDDSYGSDSDALGQVGLMNDNNTRIMMAGSAAGLTYGTNGTNRGNFETLLVSDRKTSLPRGGRSK